MSKSPRITADRDSLSNEALATVKFHAPPPFPEPGPITAEELMRRGVSDDVEGRALDVVLRCGWPRPGDPLGIKPCIPIEMRELREVLKDAEDVINMTARVELLVTFLQRKLRTQEYVMALYVEAADARAGS